MTGESASAASPTDPGPPVARPDRTRRELGLAVALCLAGAVAVLASGAATWATVRLEATALLPGRVIALSGGDLSPGARALGLVGLAGVVALVATRGRGRVVAGLVLLLVGAGCLLAVGTLLDDVAGAAVGTGPVEAADGAVTSARSTGWPLLALAGGLLLLLAGLLVVARGRAWAAMSARYEAPAVRRAAPPEGSALWDSLDRGEDPTSR